MIEISYEEVMAIHDKTIQEQGGLAGIRDQGALESALAQPYSGFGDYEAYPNLEDKVAALGFSIVRNHPFLDGNKRTGFQAMNIFLMKAGYRLVVNPEEGDHTIRALAAGNVSRAELADWIALHVETL
jgi:death-on-curing protein